MKRGCIGGLGRGVPEPVRDQNNACMAWHEGTAGLPAWLHTSGLEEQVFAWDGLALLVRGYLRPAGARDALNRERLAEELRWRYLEAGLLDLDGLEGHATAVLIDAHAGQVLLARPANSTQAVYYRATGAGLLLGSNLADLAAVSPQAPRVDPLAAATWLDLGAFPDSMTLFHGIQRLLPGEWLVWNEQGLQRGTLPRPLAPAAPWRARLEEVMHDCAGLAAQPVHLLTGSVAGIALQALRNQHLAPGEILPSTASLGIDAAPAWDQTDAILHAAMVLGTGHALIPAPTDLAADLRESIAALGEPSGSPTDLCLPHLAAQVQARGHGMVILDAGGDTWPAAENSCWQQLHQAAWTTACCQQAGLDTLCPLLDSRLFPGCDRFGRTRAGLLRDMLALVPLELRRRYQPVSMLGEWLRPGEPLWCLVERLQPGELVSEETLSRARARPGDWLYRLIAYDVWHHLFIDQGWAESESPAPTAMPAVRRS